MGNSCGGDSASKRSSRLSVLFTKQFEKDAHREFLEESQKKRVILLGAGESGKSTLFKQMIDLYTEGRSEESRISFKLPVRENILNGMTAVLAAINNFSKDDSIEISEFDELLAPLKDKVLDAAENSELTAEIAQAISTLWSSDQIKIALENREKFQYPDSLGYFVENIERVVTPDYIPSNQDILRCRVKTTGSVDLTFTIDDVKFHMTDVGGQQNERKKWIHFFDNMHAVLFVAAASEYDQTLYERDGVNRMDDSMNVFADIINNAVFDKSDVILFLNKIDLFETKIKRVPLKTHFPDYEGDPEDSAQALEYIRFMYEECNEHDKTIYFHPTTATDPDNIRHVFSDVKDIIVKGGLKHGGLV